MNCLVPLDTTNPTSTSPSSPSIVDGSFTLFQNIAAGATLASFNYGSYGLAMAPANIVPSLVRANGAESNIAVYPRAWNASVFTCDFSSPVTDNTFVCYITVIPNPVGGASTPIANQGQFYDTATQKWGTLTFSNGAATFTPNP